MPSLTSGIPDVEISGVSKSYGSSPVLQDVSLEVARGEFFALLGPSGSGKTTLLRLIGGFAEPDRGIIRVAGQDVTHLPPYRRNVNTVFQHYALFPHYDVWGNVAYGCRQQGIKGEDLKRRVAAAIELVRLTGLEKRHPRELSGGQQQRVALARALVLRPAVLLLDEPLGALDLKLRKQMQVELKNLQEQVGITFVYVTHDQEEALTMSDQIAVMNAGSILQVGSPREIYERPSCRFVADFIGESNFLTGRVDHQSDGLAWVETPVGTVPASADAPMEEGQMVNVAIRPEKMSVLSSDDASIVVRGRLERVIYAGVSSQAQVRLTDETLLQVRLSGGERVTAPGIGDEVGIGWRAADARVLST
jgi:spermidine/putrescine transport system ATP-binding protein